jgi:hypothetical protein
MPTASRRRLSISHFLKYLTPLTAAFFMPAGSAAQADGVGPLTNRRRRFLKSL